MSKLTYDFTTYKEEDERVDYYISRIRDLYMRYKINNKHLEDFVNEGEMRTPDDPVSPYNAYILHDE